MADSKAKIGNPTEMGEGVSHTKICCGRSMDIFSNNIFQKKAILYQENLSSDSYLCITTDTINEYKHM